MIRLLDFRQDVQVEESVAESDVGQVKCDKDASIAPKEHSSVYIARSVRHESAHHLVPYVILMLDRYWSATVYWQ